MRAVPLLLLAGTLGGGEAVLAQSPEEVARGREAQQQAAAAYQAGNMPEFLAAAERADALRPAHPTILYNLACARARNGDRDGAIAVLGRLADMGLVFDPAADPDFAGLVDDPALLEVAERFTANAGPVGTSETAFGLPWRDFVPEGIARDPGSGAFFVSGVHARRVVRVDTEGRAQPFAEGLWSALGMALDPTRRVLWIGTAAMPETAGVDSTEIGRGTVIGVDLESGRRVAELGLSADGPHVPGDLSLAPDGTLFVSDATAGVLWVLRPGAEALEVLTGPDVLVSPQGSTLSTDGRTLWLADYALGILAIDPMTGAAHKLDQPTDAALLGIDALVRDGDDLIAVQNGVRPARVLRLGVDTAAGAVRSWEVVAAALPEFEEPTGATAAEGRLYLIANSHWDRFEDGVLRNPESLTPPLILSIGLDASTVMLEN